MARGGNHCDQIKVKGRTLVALSQGSVVCCVLCVVCCCVLCVVCCVLCLLCVVCCVLCVVCCVLCVVFVVCCVCWDILSLETMYNDYSPPPLIIPCM